MSNFTLLNVKFWDFSLLNKEILTFWSIFQARSRKNQQIRDDNSPESQLSEWMKTEALPALHFIMCFNRGSLGFKVNTLERETLADPGAASATLTQRATYSQQDVRNAGVSWGTRVTSANRADFYLLLSKRMWKSGARLRPRARNPRKNNPQPVGFNQAPEKVWFSCCSTSRFRLWCWRQFEDITGFLQSFIEGDAFVAFSGENPSFRSVLGRLQDDRAGGFSQPTPSSSTYFSSDFPNSCFLFCEDIIPWFYVWRIIWISRSAVFSCLHEESSILSISADHFWKSDLIESVVWNIYNLTDVTRRIFLTNMNREV